MRGRSLLTLSFSLVLGASFAPRSVHADWPPAVSVPREQLADSANWPNDPDYGGQWYLWSWIPTTSASLPGFRTPELATGAGNHADRAWQLTTGDSHVLISILDSGIKWDERDLQLKAAINTHELPLPQLSNGTTATSYDADGDGRINVGDYLGDARVPCGTGTPSAARLRACIGADGHPNDPNANGVFDAGDLIRIFSDNVDDDHNGYIDDISGWDFFHDDNDPYDDTRYGHGTGEANDSTAQANNGISGAGNCPECMFVPLRAGDSFIADVSDFAQAVIYAVDADYGEGRRVRVIQEALGTLDNNDYAMAAIDYAYKNGRVIIGSAADENSRHHNMPGTNNHIVYTHANTFNGSSSRNSTSYLSFNNCTNYGGQLQLSAAAATCSSGAVGYASGLVGLLQSDVYQRNVTPPLSPEEVRQLLINTTDDINIPESIPGAANYNTTLYPSLPGWDQRFGYGRVNIRTVLDHLRAGQIPPEVDITSPRWFTTVHPDQPGHAMLFIEGSIAARRTAVSGGSGAQDFDYAIEWARGIEPAESDWQAVPSASGTHVTSELRDTRLAGIDFTNITVDNPGEVENRFTISVRIRATAHYGGTAGDVHGETRRVFYIVRDPDLLPGFPLDVHSSGESSPHLVDLNGDGAREIVSVTSNGYVHAIQGNGTELAGFPVHMGPDTGLDPARTPSYRSAPAYSGAHPAIDPDAYFEAVIATPAIGDLDGDTQPEIVVAGYHGTVNVFRHDGTPYGHGFPKHLPDVPSSDTSPKRVLARGIFGSPVIYDLNNDHRPEIIIGAMDAHVYVFDSMTAADVPGFPVLVHLDEPNSEYNRIFGSIGVGHIDGDNIPDLVVVSNNRPPEDNGLGTLFVLHGDGNLHAGGAVHPNYPIVMISFDLFPMLGEGLSTSPPIGDVDGDGKDDLVLVGTGGPTTVVAHGEQIPHPMRPELNQADQIARISIIDTGHIGALSNIARGGLTSFLNAFSIGSFGDLNNDGTLEFTIVGASPDLAINLQGGAGRRPFQHYLGAWDSRTGRPMPGYPHVVEDYGFFANPTIGDVSGDSYPEVLVGTGGYYVHASDACGREAPGFPKFTGQWVIPSPAVGDIDNAADHLVEVATNTRSGYVYAWKTRGSRDGSMQWPTFRHDPQNTGNWGTPLDFGVRRVTGQPTLVCPLPDAGTTDAGNDASVDSAVAVNDAGPVTTDAGTTVGTDASATVDAGGGVGGGGCGCRTAGGTRTGTPVAWLAVGGAIAALAARRRRAA